MQTIATISAEQRVNTITAGDQVSPRAAGLADGSYVVVWWDRVTGDIEAQRFDVAGAKLGGEFRVNTTTVSNQFGGEPAVVGVEGGGFAAAWKGLNNSVVSQLFDASGLKVGGEQLNAGGPDPGWTDSPSLAALGGGGYVVVVHDLHEFDGELDSESHDLFAQRYNAAGTAVGDSFLVHNPSASEERNPSATSLADGGFVVAWDRQALEGVKNGQFFLQRFNASGAKVGGEVMITLSGEGTLGQKAVAGLADGGFVVTYFLNSRDEPLVFKRYDATGAQVGSETRVSTTEGQHVDASVLALPDGGFAVTWSPFVQRFSASGARVGSEVLFRSDTVAALHEGGLLALLHGQVGGATDLDILQHSIGPLIKGSTLSNALEVGSGDRGDNTFLAVPGAFGEGDQVLGEGGHDRIRLTAPGVADFTGVYLKSVEEILGSDQSDTFVVDDISLADVASINGRGGDDTVVTGEGSLNLVGKTLTKIEHITTSNADGTNFAVDSVAEALLVDGAGAHDTVTATSLTFGESQLRKMFNNGVEEVVDASGAHQAPMSTLAAAKVNSQRVEDVTSFDALDVDTLAAAATAGLNTPAIRGTPGPDTIQAPNIPSLVKGLAGDDRLLGGEGNDRIFGGFGNDHIEGGFAGGSDTLNGEQGNDYLVAVDGDDILIGDAGDDTLDAGAGDDVLRGGAGADSLFASPGNDTASGEGGDDNIRGGLGDDLLSGGPGDDDYRYEGPGVPDIPGFDHDTILDFKPGQDQLVLELFGPLVTFEDLDISVAKGDTLIDLSTYRGHEAGTDTILLLNVTTLSAVDVFIF